MTMKRSIMKFIALCTLALALCIGLVACAEECEHAYDNACDTACNDCGQTREITHDFTEPDCDTPKTCTVCQATEGEANGHTPKADDGDCTTALLCETCEHVIVEPKASHVPGTDDGDCTTDLLCESCEHVVVKAEPSHIPEADDGECTTAQKCIKCDQVAIEGRTDYRYEGYGDGYGSHTVYCPCGEREIGREDCHDSTPVCGEFDVCDHCGYLLDDRYERFHSIDETTGKCSTCGVDLAEAVVDGKYFTHLAFAFNEADGKTITLLKDIPDSFYLISVSSGDNITVDLNGFDIAHRDSLLFMISGSLTIINTSSEESVISSNMRVMDVYENGRLKIGANIRFESQNYTVIEPSNSANQFIDLSLVNVEGITITNWGCPDFKVGNNILIPEGYVLLINGDTKDTIKNGDTATLMKASE